VEAAVVLVFVLGVGLVVALAVRGHRRERMRSEALRSLAADHGWTYAERDDAWCEAFDGLPFGTGHNRQARNVVTGSHRGRSLVLFDYVYYTTETDRDAQGNTRTREVPHAHAVVGIGVGADVPRLSVAPEGFFGRAIGKLLGNDIELESEEFNRAFRVRSDDRRFAYDVLHPRLMEYLLTVRETSWRTTNATLVTTSPGRHRPEDVEARIAVLDRILESVPDFVRRQYGMPVPPSVDEERA
jgi:hypothetical protein